MPRVSSFGFSGTNAHVVLEQAPTPPELESGPEGEEPQLLCVSAKSPAALGALLERHRRQLHEEPDITLAERCRTAALGRSHFPHRLALAARDNEQLAARLPAAIAAVALADGATAATEAAATEARAAAELGVRARLWRGHAGGGGPRVAMSLPGQGAHHPHLLAGLYRRERALRERVDRGAAIVRELAGFDVRELLVEGEHPERLEDTRYAQPALFVAQYALGRSWMEWGVSPAGLIGHSLGEYVAATLGGVGVFDYARGLRVVCARAQLMG